MDKKGFIRTLEAVIAIILILGFLFFVMPRGINKDSELPKNVEQAQKFILNSMSENKDYRSCILGSVSGSCKSIGNCADNINTFVKDNIPLGYDYECEICDSVESCINLPVESAKKSIYVDSVFIAAKKSKIFRLYMWRKA